jgi:hypothetical protein
MANATIRGTRPTVAMLMYPGMTMLDLIGPHEALSHLTEVPQIRPSTADHHPPQRNPPWKSRDSALNRSIGRSKRRRRN